VADPLITKEQLIARLGQNQFDRVFDDNNDGKADKLSEEQVRKDASSKVRGAIGPVYTQAQLTSATEELVRITLDVAEAMATRRRPTILKGDWTELMAQADKDLKAVRMTMANLGTDDSARAGRKQRWRGRQRSAPDAPTLRRDVRA
jgi:phage gp36-like protein